jgi:hypothetical protein
MNIPEKSKFQTNDFFWSDFLRAGERLLNYMGHNYNDMINDKEIRDFEIVHISGKLDDEVINLDDNYKTDIQKKLIQWIKHEFECGNLFEKTYWKPFRDWSCISLCVLGYKKMFQYKNYYLQLIISSCSPVKYKDITDDNYAYFNLALYGWIESGKENLQPDNKVIIPPDNIMPDWYWNIY